MRSADEPEGEGDPVTPGAPGGEQGAGGPALAVLGVGGVQQLDGGGVPGHRHRRRLTPVRLLPRGDDLI